MSRLGPYMLLRRIGVGGMAEIFLAKREGPAGFAKVVALKRILPHLSTLPDFVDMFLDEARLAARLSHPHIVQIYDFGNVDGAYFIAMEYVPGEDLLAILRQSRDKRLPVPPVVAAAVLVAAAEALHYAHELRDEEGRPLGIVHRDVTPSNLLVSYDGVVKLADFGIAKAERRGSHTAAGALKGKYAYMSPEYAVGGKVDRRSDVFSLGVLGHELLTGQRLFHRSSELAVLKAITEETIPPPSALRAELPPELDAIVMRALERDPARRFATAQELQLALEQFLLGYGSAGAKIQLAEWLHDLFGDEVAVARRRWAAGELDDGEPTSALAGPPVKSAAAVVGPLADSPTLVKAAGEATRTVAEPPRPSRSRRAAWVAGAVVLAAAIAAGVVGLSRGGAPPEPATAAATTDVTAVRGQDLEAPILEPIARPAPPSSPSPAATAAPDAGAPRAEAPRPAPPRDRDRDRDRDRGKKEAWLTIDVTPWSEVLLDGKSIGSTPIARYRITPGRHTVTLVGREEGYRLTYKIHVEPGQEYVEKRTLGKGKLVADAEPWADVYAGGRKLGTTPLAPVALTEGVYIVRFSNPQLQRERTVRVVVRAGQTTRVKETLE